MTTNCYSLGHNPQYNDVMDIFQCSDCQRLAEKPEDLNTLFYRFVWGMSELTGISLGRLAPYVFGKIIKREPNPYTPRTKLSDVFKRRRK